MKVRSLDFLVANWASFFALEPLVDAGRVVLVRASGQPLHHLTDLKILKADSAGLVAGVISVLPLGLRDWVDHFLLQSFWNFAVSVFELEQLFIAHEVRVWIVGVGVASAGLNGLSQHPFLSSFEPLLADQASIHHRHKEHLFFTLMLAVLSHQNNSLLILLFPSGLALSISDRSGVHPHGTIWCITADGVLQLRDFGSKFIVLLPKTRDIVPLLVDHSVLWLKRLDKKSLR